MRVHQKIQSGLINNSYKEKGFTLISTFCEICPLKKDNLILHTEKGYWQKQHERTKEREEKLKKENEQLKARIRYLENQLYGKKTEKKTITEKETANKKNTSSKPKGQQANNPGPQRREYKHLPVIEAEIDLAEEEKACPFCGLPFEPFPGTEDSETIEYETITYRRREKRKRYRKRCSCTGVPGIVNAPKKDNIITKGRIGTSLWVEILINKFQLQIPLNKILQKFSLEGASFAPGTIVGGLKKIAPLFIPIYNAIHKKSLEADWWHADETRWLVFIMQEGKLSYRWYLWVFISECTVYYMVDPSRSTRVVKKYFGVIEEGILCVDRYSAYKSFAKDKANFILAFCWDHTRRDFIKVGKEFPDQEEWAMNWKERIGKIYHINNQRITHSPCTDEFQKKEKELRKALDELIKKRELELKLPRLNTGCRKALESMKNHWDGLTVFVDHPHIPMSNGEAERMMRNPALGRKNYYGSKAEWSAEYTAMMFSIFQTMRKNRINQKKWLNSYLLACAQNKGKAPPDISRFLPWNMSEKEKQEYG
jgi:transposase